MAIQISGKKHAVVIIGGGIVGLATAYHILKRKKIDLVLLEKENTLAIHQTGSNSGVIHSGIYYKPGSLKSRNCIEGYKLLLDFCRNEGIKFDICGKIIAAGTDRERVMLKTLYERGKANGLKGLKYLDAQSAREIEPHVSCLEAVWVPQTGIINYRKVCEILATRISEMGGAIQLGEKVVAIVQQGSELTIDTMGGRYETKFLISAAGLYSDHMVKLSGLVPDYQILPFRGEYYKLRPECSHLVRNLIYPVPNPEFPFLGVHFTRMIEGGVEAGPNAVIAMRREGYAKRDVDWSEMLEILKFRGFRKLALKYWKYGLVEEIRSHSKFVFLKSLQKLIPAISKKDIEIAPSGVRAQACTPDGLLIDDFHFAIGGNFIHVCNAPSPAATASLAIGDRIAKHFFGIQAD